MSSRTRKNRVAPAEDVTIITPMSTEPAFVDSRDFARIARAIRFIDDNFRSQPRLATIAGSARLSEFHFNRLFRRWAGITPRQYLAFVTGRAARSCGEPDTPGDGRAAGGRTAIRAATRPGSGPLALARSECRCRRRDRSGARAGGQRTTLTGGPFGPG